MLLKICYQTKLHKSSRMILVILDNTFVLDDNEILIIDDNIFLSQFIEQYSLPQHDDGSLTVA